MDRQSNLVLSSDKQIQFNFEVNNEKCPDCGSRLIPDGGCKVCVSCGWSACSI